MGDELKRNSVMEFCDGKLTIKMEGHGSANGWGEFAFPEDQIELEDGFALVEIAPSELRELRDFIDRAISSQD